tara:strand:- start:266 stop:445 length:180 start_codon:yes stop_codon:yes gene_type:complete
MDKKKQIEELYTDALYNDEAPNVFADRILSLFSVVESVVIDESKVIKTEPRKVKEGWGR